MTARAALAFSPSGRDVSTAKRSARAAYTEARNAGALSPAIVDKLWADTLLAVEGEPASVASEMYTRSQHLFILLCDRGTW
jgi:hypothetical protein